MKSLLYLLGAAAIIFLSTASLTMVVSKREEKRDLISKIAILLLLTLMVITLLIATLQLIEINETLSPLAP